MPISRFKKSILFFLAQVTAFCFFTPHAIATDMKPLPKTDAPLSMEQVEKLFPIGRIYTKESVYNNIYIKRDAKSLTMGFALRGEKYGQCQKRLGKPLYLAEPYTRMMTLATAYAEKAESVLDLGLGCGATSGYIKNHMPDIMVDAVEIDPAVVDIAVNYFGAKPGPGYAVHEADARVFLTRNKGPWDVIFVDAYRGHHIPFHLMTQEFYRLVASRLAPGGAAAFNLVKFNNSHLFAATFATLRSVFQYVGLYGTSTTLQHHPHVAIATNAPVGKATLLKRAKHLQARYGFLHSVPKLLKNREVDIGSVVGDGPTPILTDDFAPVNILKLRKVKDRK